MLRTSEMLNVKKASYQFLSWLGSSISGKWPLASIPEKSPTFELVVINCSFLTYWDRLAYHLQQVASRDWAMLHHRLGECEPIVRVPATLLQLP